MLQKKEAELVRQHCETLNNILLSEFDHFSRKVVEDFEGMMENFLREQANYHRQVIHYRSLYWVFFSKMHWACPVRY